VLPVPPNSDEFPAFTSAEAGTRFSKPGGCKVELTWVVGLHTKIMHTKCSV